MWVIAVGVVVFGVLAVAFAYRFERIRTYFDTFRGDFSNPQGAAYQSYQGMLSLADGGVWIPAPATKPSWVEPVSHTAPAVVYEMG